MVTFVRRDQPSPPSGSQRSWWSRCRPSPTSSPPATTTTTITTTTTTTTTIITTIWILMKTMPLDNVIKNDYTECFVMGLVTKETETCLSISFKILWSIKKINICQIFCLQLLFLRFATPTREQERSKIEYTRSTKRTKKYLFTQLFYNKTKVDIDRSTNYKWRDVNQLSLKLTNSL